jgi:addiction module RelB/DinJ family antitoxin
MLKRPKGRFLFIPRRLLHIDMLTIVYTMVSMNTVLNVKIDPELKKQAQAVAKELGLPVSTVVSASLRNFVSTRSITISDSPHLKPEVETELLALSKKARAGNLEDFSPTFDSLEEGFAWLDS